MTRGAARVLIVTLAGGLTIATTAHAESGWALWERAVNPTTGQPQGEWQRRQLFEAERWCRGAMTRAINETLAAGRKGNRWDPAAKITEYQCLPENQDPRAATNR